MGAGVNFVSYLNALGPATTPLLSFSFSLSTPLPAFPGVTSQIKGFYVTGGGAPRCDALRGTQTHGYSVWPGRHSLNLSTRRWDGHKMRRVLLNKERSVLTPNFHVIYVEERLWKGPDHRRLKR